ncbi:MAG: TonB-dependent receptor [Gemmatimonadetes bacterium]|nr:TonB-dependent receptor [Gemmatimonadota bacterium]
MPGRAAERAAAGRRRIGAVSAGIVILASATAPAHAMQDRTVQSDSSTVTRLDALVVSIERTALPLRLATGAVTVLTREDLRGAPVRTLADAVQRAPGAAFFDRDGLGGDPQLVMRGFYGGGEAEYALLVLDGQPLNHLESGRIDWDLIPLSSIESIEIVRGGMSGAWGDAAIGGVIHVRTRSSGALGANASLSGGAHGTLRASGSYRGAVDGRSVMLFGHATRTDGFREHGRRAAAAVHIATRVAGTASRGVDVSTTHAWREFDDPGPLAEADAAVTRTASAPFYRFDHATERTHRLGLDGRTAGSAGRLSGSLNLERRRADQVRTLPLAPTFADTQNRVFTSWRAAAMTRLELDELSLPGEDDLVLGVDAALGWFDSEYYAFLAGAPDAYAGADATRGELDQRGSGTRAALGLFLGYGVAPAPAVRITAGARVDWLRDGFEAMAPDSAPRETATHVALSPRIGVNVRVLETRRQRAYVHAGATRSFKAPTPDQLFDLRRIPVPFPPFETGFANARLEPQYGTSIEVGLVHEADLVPGRLAGTLSASVYRMSLRDELDFSVETLRYENIGRSRHTGAEIGVAVRGPASLSAFANYTRQSATATSGENPGKRLKAIPLHWLVAGLAAGDAGGFMAGITLTRADRMFIDDANTRELPAWIRWDARVAWGAGPTRIFAHCTNLLDAKYSTTAFPDPAGTGIDYVYPAAGRTIEIGIGVEWQ